jgi:hypothetical protein
MKVLAKADNRSEIDKRYDTIYNKMVRDARLTPLQENIVATYLHKIMQMRIHEIEGVVEMAYLIALIESEHYGTDPKRSSRIHRVQACATEAINEAYGHSCIDSAGFWCSYDGCGYERMLSHLHRLGLEYENKLIMGVPSDG